MPGTLISPPTPGLYNSSNHTQDLAVKDFASMIVRLMPNGTAPLFAMTAQMRTETATNVEHGYFAKTMVFPEFSLTANTTNSATVLTVNDTSNLIPGMIFRAQATGENIIVNAILSTTSVSVTRGIGGGATAITIATDPVEFYQVGNAYEEGSLRPNAMAINPVRITNLTQIFRNSFAITGTAAAVKVIAGDDTAQENERDGAQFHATSIETALIFGKKSQGVRNGQPFRTMDGIISTIGNLAYYPPSYAAPNVFTAATAGTSMATLEGYLDPLFNQTTDYSTANTRLAFVGGTAMRVINALAMMNGEYQLVQSQTEWGLRFKTLTFARGTFNLIEHPLFNTNKDWSKMLLAVDPATFNVAYLGGRKTDLKYFNQAGSTVAQDNGIDAFGGTLTTEMTMLCKNPPANGVIFNLTKAIANA